MNEGELQIHAEIFSQLLQSERFRDFMNLNFTIHKLVNDEEKTIEIRVIEKPPQVVAQELAQRVAAAQGEEENRIQIASASLAEKVVKQAEAQARAAKKRR